MSLSSRHQPPSPPVRAAAAVALAVAVGVIALVALGRSRHHSRTATRTPQVPAGAGPPPYTMAGAGAVPLRPPGASPEQVAAAFTAGYLTFHWDDAPGALRRRCRPFDTAEVDAALGWPGEPPNQARRVAARESDVVEVLAVDAQDRAVDHLDATVVARLTVERPGRPRQAADAFVDLRVVNGATGWAVAQVDR